VRSQGGAVHELYEAGDALREAQASLLAGSGDGRALRAANERERAAVETLVAAARGLLDSDGHELSPSVVERIADTLHAAALDEGAREQVRAGRLERELRHAGLGLGESVFAPVPAPARGAKPAKEPAAKRRKPAAAQGETKQQRAERARAVRDQAEAAKRLERERDAARKAARSAETAARRRAERSAHALRAAEKRRERAAHALGEADEALAAARAEAQAAAAEHKRARAALERL